MSFDWFPWTTQTFQVGVGVHSDPFHGAMGCGLSRPTHRRRRRSAQSIRPVSDCEEESPLLEAVSLDVKPQSEGDMPKKAAGTDFACKVCVFNLAILLAAAIILLVVCKDLPFANSFGPCFTQQIQRTIHWAVMASEHWKHLLLLGILLPALFFLKKQCLSAARLVIRHVYGEEAVDRFFVRAEVLQMLFFWLADMLSDMYVTYKYLKYEMYMFAALMITIWIGSGCIAFGHRYVSWKLCDCESNVDYWAQGLNESGEAKPGIRSFVLYVAQLQPMIIAWNSMDGNGRSIRFLHEEKMLSALSEGAPSSLLQLYAMLLEPPQTKFDALIFCGSIAMSIYTVSEGVNKAFELCTPEDRKMERIILPKSALLGFRWWDVFSRVCIFALLGVCLRPTGAKRHGLQQPFLPFIMAGELLLMALVFKSQSLGLNLTWSKLFEKQYFLSGMGCYLGTYWCCNGADLVAQHRLFRCLVAVRLFETLGTLWFCALAYSASVAGQCRAAEQPVVVVMALLVLMSFLFTFIVAVLHDLSMSFLARPFFPVVAGQLGGRLELAARFGVASQIPKLLEASQAEDTEGTEGTAALCQAAEAGQVSVIHALIHAGISATAPWEDRSALHWAAKGGHIPAIQALQALGENDLEQVDLKGFTAAILAAMMGHLEVVKYLHMSGCNLEHADKDGYTVVSVAAQNGHLEVVKYLGAHGCQLDQGTKDGYTAVILAAQHGHLEVVTYLQSAGCDLNKVANNGYSACILAAMEGHLEVVKFLHLSGCNLEKSDQDGYNACILAAQDGHVDIVKYLHTAGCDLDKVTDHGYTAASVAAHNGHLEVVRYAHTSGSCDLEKAAKNGYTAAILAAMEGHLEVLKYLYVAGCHLEKSTNDGATAVILAAENGHLEVVKYLHSIGCDLNKLDNHGSTAATFAASEGHLEVLQFLHVSGCLLTLRTLHLAVAAGRLKVVAFLLAEGCEVNGLGIGKVRALDLADETVATVLLEHGAIAGPTVRLVGLTALTPKPALGNGWFTGGVPQFARTRGKFYHEIQLLSDFETLQLGWLSTDFLGETEGNGVGDDSHGWAFDGHRCCWWHNGSEPLALSPWKVNDVLGFAIDFDKSQMHLMTRQQQVTKQFQVNSAVYLGSYVSFVSFKCTVVVFKGEFNGNFESSCARSDEDQTFQTSNRELLY